MRPLPLLLALMLSAPALAGCTLPWQGEDEPWYPQRPTVDNEPGPPLTWSGTVTDAATGEPVPDAAVTLHLAQHRPCQRQGIGWTSWDVRTDANGTFGPFDTATPKSRDVAFFLRVDKDGYSPRERFFGPKEASAGTTRIDIDLHPEATVEGRAPPGTVIALDAPGYPRLTSADAEGRWAFPDARIEPRSLVIATEPPHHERVDAPALVEPEPKTNASAWYLQGNTRLESGAALVADIVAWNGTTLWSAARSNDRGQFTLPLPAGPTELRLEARTAHGEHGGTITLKLNGPPALRETILMRPLC